MLDSSQLTSGEQQELTGAFDRAGFFALPPRRVSGMPDVIQYRLSADFGDRRHEIAFDAQTADAQLTDLVERIVRLAEKRAT